jgi:metal-sulfur cluster biosynthetic enzyme
MIAMQMENNSNLDSVVTTYEIIVEQLQSVFDPEFPLVDIYTMGLIYDIQPDDIEKHITITMTFTSPSCPAAELIETMIKNAVSEALPTYTLEINIVRDPARTYHMMKDDDLKRMFE